MTSKFFLMKNVLITGAFILIVNYAKAQSFPDALTKPCLSCESLKELQLPDVSIMQTAMINEPSPHCKVLGVIGKEIKFEVLLPEKWNSRFVMGGGGGFSGRIQNSARKTINHGFASAGTDTGHQGPGISADWAYYNVERQLNFGHLAIHRTAVTAKEIIRQYYCAGIDFSYFYGCSRGGGQAMMEAQKYPADFDGIVAGAPAFTWPAMCAEFFQNSKKLYPEPDDSDNPVISAAHLKLLHEQVLLQCDELDGVKDGILNDPQECKIDFSKLPSCKSNKPVANCFTEKQIDAVKTIYKGVEHQGKLIYPGFAPGAENDGGWERWIIGPNAGTLDKGYPTLHLAFGSEVFKYFVYHDSTWNFRDFNINTFAEDTKFASSFLDATSTNYQAFKENGAKMIIYHGWNDAALSALATIDHYEKAMKEDEQINDHIRLFLLPGVKHCGGGNGPDQVDWLALIISWVENGIAPERVVAKKTKDGKVIMTRPVFPYPQKAKYSGSGDPFEESNFTNESDD